MKNSLINAIIAFKNTENDQKNNKNELNKPYLII